MSAVRYEVSPAKPRRKPRQSGPTQSEEARAERGMARVVLRMPVGIVATLDALRGSQPRSGYVAWLLEGEMAKRDAVAQTRKRPATR